MSSVEVQSSNHSGLDSDISADGRYVVFSTKASNLVRGDTNGDWDVFVRDRRTNAWAARSVRFRRVQPGRWRQPRRVGRVRAQPWYRISRPRAGGPSRGALVGNGDILRYRKGTPMSNLLVRDLPEAVMAALDAQAARLGLSRSEFVRRRLTNEARRTSGRVTMGDLDRFARTFDDLADDDLMRQAWS
jgi:hypothetical protein